MLANQCFVMCDAQSEIVVSMHDLELVAHWMSGQSCGNLLPKCDSGPYLKTK